jgi:hypothetical protein
MPLQCLCYAVTIGSAGHFRGDAESRSHDLLNVRPKMKIRKNLALERLRHRIQKVARSLVYAHFLRCAPFSNIQVTPKVAPIRNAIIADI